MSTPDNDARYNFIDIEDQRPGGLLPSGKYHVQLDETREQEVQNGENEGARMVSLQFRVQETDPHEDKANRVVFDNLVCVKGSLWKAKAFFDAVFANRDDLDINKMGYDPASMQFLYYGDNGEEVIDIDDFKETDLVIQVGKQKGGKNKETGEQYEDRNKVSAYFPYEKTEADMLP